MPTIDNYVYLVNGDFWFSEKVLSMARELRNGDFHRIKLKQKIEKLENEVRKERG